MPFWHEEYMGNRLYRYILKAILNLLIYKVAYVMDYVLYLNISEKCKKSVQFGIHNS